MKKLGIKFIVGFCLTLGFVFVLTNQVKASAPYKTNTLNRYEEWIQTQDAYEPILSIKSFNNGDTLKNPRDVFIDEEDTLYIVDTGNKRIVVLDKDFNYVRSFGETTLLNPQGIYVRNQYIYVADFDLQKIVVFNQDGTIYKIYEKPNSPVLNIENMEFKPRKIAVDANLTMYVIIEGSPNGALIINEEGRFLNYFGGNTVDGNFLDLVKKWFYEDNENVILRKNIPLTPYNIMLDDSGYIYTVSQYALLEGRGDALKKLNIGGINYYPKYMHISPHFVDAWPGSVGNLYAVSEEGIIYEYDNEGQVLFRFAGSGFGIDKLGLFSAVSAIAVNSNQDLIILDANRCNFQVFRRTQFAQSVHQALELYNNGRYKESKAHWEEVLRYNSMFDLAHQGMGMAYYLNNEYDKALNEFQIANDYEHYSEVYWEIRNEFLIENMGIFILSIIIIFIVYLVHVQMKKRFDYLTPIKNQIKKIRKIRWIDQSIYMFYFLKNPADACYEVKRKNRVSIEVAIGFILLLFIIYVGNILYTGYLFNQYIIEETQLFKEALKILIPILTFVFANYLISSLMEGEGTLKAIFINVVGALLPVIIMFPFLILISNFITYNESFIYLFGMTVMFIYTGIMLIAIIKETHNFTVTQLIVNLLLTILMMIVLVLVVVMTYMIVLQVVSFILDIVKEVMISG